uniref:Uncharacterized protein n=1 Tax=Setaria italica TaxID=4555 RepID=A0A341LNP2_SETIT
MEGKTTRAAVLAASLLVLL